MKTGQKGISSNFKSPPTFEVFFDAHKSWYVNRCSIFSRYMPTLVMDYLNCSLRLRMKYARSSIRLIGYCPSLKEKGVTGLILWLVNWRTIWHLHLAISNLFLWLLKVWVKVWCASVPPRKRGGEGIIWICCHQFGMKSIVCCLLFHSSLSRTFGLVLKQLRKFRRELELEVWLRQIHDHNSINAPPLPINFAKQK